MGPGPQYFVVCIYLLPNMLTETPPNIQQFLMLTFGNTQLHIHNIYMVVRFDFGNFQQQIKG